MKTKYFFNPDFVKKQSIYTPNSTSLKLPFYLYGCGEYCCDEQYYTKREGLNNFLLIYTLNGKGLIDYRNNDFSVSAGDCFVIDCKEYQYYRTAPKSNWEFLYAHFKGVCADEYLQILYGNSFNIINIQNEKLLTDLFQQLFYFSELKSELIDIKISLTITKLFTLMIEEKQKSLIKLNLKHKTEIDTVKDYIDINHFEEINLDSLSNKINISKFYLIKLFKELTGLTPYEYLIQVRISNSKRLLKETDYSISDIASKVGFSDINNFIKTFKKFTNTTPLKYRQHWID